MLDMSAVPAAIDACDRDRGGTVLVRRGVFVIGTIQLNDNVTLRTGALGNQPPPAEIDLPSGFMEM
jgi:polygalacturonase